MPLTSRRIGPRARARVPHPACEVGGRRRRPVGRSEPADVRHPHRIEEAMDEARFQAFFDVHYRAIARYFLARGHRAADADDLVATTFVVARRRWDAVPPGEEAVPWLIAVARNHSREAARQRQCEGASTAELSSTVSASEEMEIAGREEFAETMEALARLRPLDRDLILLVTWDELSPSDAGRVLGLRPTAARSRLHQARQRLAVLLQAESSGVSAAGPVGGGGRSSSGMTR